MDLPKRKPVRLKDFDYSSQGAYFVTICTKYRIKLFEIETVGNGLKCRSVYPKSNRT